MDAEQEGNCTWTCVEALYEMFFSDLDNYSSDGISTKDIRSLIAKNLSGSTATNPGLCHQDNILICEKVDTILKIEPRLKPQVGMSRISWYRFGFRAQLDQVALSNNFVKSFGRWRLRLSLTGKAHTVCNLGIGRKTPKKQTDIGIAKFSGFTMDNFFHSAKKITLFSDNIKWQLTRLDSKEKRNGASDSKANPRKRSIEEIVGARNYIAIKECISIAARDGKFYEIEAKKIEGRYPSTVTRDELAELLLSRFPERLACPKSVIKRALSEFVFRRHARQRAFG